MTHHTQNQQSENTGSPTTGWPGLAIDWDLFGQCLEDSDLTDEEIRETIEAYWFVAVSFVDLGLGIHPAQLATKSACEQNDSLVTPESACVVDCLDTPNLQTPLAEFTASAHGDAKVRTGRKPQKERNPR